MVQTIADDIAKKHSVFEPSGSAGFLKVDALNPLEYDKVVAAIPVHFGYKLQSGARPARIQRCADFGFRFDLNQLTSSQV